MRRPFRWLIATAAASLAFAVLPAAALATFPPVIEWTSAWNLTPTDATLGAGIETNGLYTGYEFQIDTNASYDFTQFDCPFSLPGFAECESITVGEPLPAGLVEPSPAYLRAGLGRQSVSLNLASVGAILQPGTEYHYRVLASNGGQTVVSPDQTFTTPPAGRAPVIESVSISHLTPTDATLEAQIDTEGLSTSYEFQLWSSPCSHKGAGCEVIVDVPLPTGLLLGSFIPQDVSLDLNSAGVTLGRGEYGFSVVAANQEGSTSEFGGVFEAPLGVIDPPSPGVLPPAPTGGGPSGPPAGGGQPGGSGTPSLPALQTSSPLGGSSKTGTEKPKPEHGHGKHHKRRHHGTNAAKHPAKSKKRKG